MSYSRSSILDALRILVGPGATTELRAPNTKSGTVAGYFSDIAKLAQAAASLSGRVPVVYITLNPVRDDLLARADNHLTQHAKHTTADADVLNRRWFPADFDPVRPAGISATDAEHDAALIRARECRDWLRARGWPEPVLADSGNGGHLLYRLDLPNDSAATATVKRCLEALALHFSDDKVILDTATYNAGRIWKTYGTLAAKGDSTSGRPHRLARMLEIPGEASVVPQTLLEELASHLPVRQNDRQPASGDGAIKLEDWLAAQGLSVAAQGAWNGGKKFILNRCPWNSEHQNRSAYLVQFPNGAIAAGCLHSSCQDNGWPELRKLYGQSQSDAKPEVSTASGYLLKPLRTVFDEPKQEKPYLVGGILPKGGLSGLISKPKVGKSTLARQLALAVAHGEPFLDRAVQQGTVVYLALEEKQDEVERHFRALGATGDEPIYIHCAPAPEGALPELKKTLEKHPAILVIIDTLFKLTRVRDCNDYAQVTAALEPVLTLARSSGAHLMALHHAGKADRAEPGDAILGSTAILGNVDTAIFLRRRGAQRTISTMQRYGEDMPETMLDFDPARRAVTLGMTHEQSERVTVEDAIYDFVAANPNVPEADILSSVEGRRQRKVTALRSLLGPRSQRQGRGGKADPYQYTTTATVSCSQELPGTAGTTIQECAQPFEIEGEILVPGTEEQEPEDELLWEQEQVRISAEPSDAADT
jgi:hypothetical protein